jgi:hypothetical protein
MNFLFGHLYNTPCVFSHDQVMLQKQSNASSSFLSNSGQASLTELPSGPRDVSSAVPSKDAGEMQQIPRRPQDKTFQDSSNISSSAVQNSSPSQTYRVPRATCTTKQPIKSNFPSKPRITSAPDRGPDTQLRHEMNTSLEPSRKPERQRKRRRKSSSSDPLTSVATLPDPHIPLSPRSVSYAQRKEAFDALQEEDGVGWSRISLVSVDRHQEREVEL